MQEQHRVLQRNTHYTRELREDLQTAESIFAVADSTVDAQTTIMTQMRDQQSFERGLRMQAQVDAAKSQREVEEQKEELIDLRLRICRLETEAAKARQQLENTSRELAEAREGRQHAQETADRNREELNQTRTDTRMEMHQLHQRNRDLELHCSELTTPRATMTQRDIPRFRATINRFRRFAHQVSRDLQRSQQQRAILESRIRALQRNLARLRARGPNGHEQG